MALRASDIDALLSPAPVQSRPRGLRASDIDALIGAPTLNARASGSAGAVNKKAEAIWGGSFDDWKKRKEADDAERARMVAESEAGNVGSRRAQDFQRKVAALNKEGDQTGDYSADSLRAGRSLEMGMEQGREQIGAGLQFAGETPLALADFFGRIRPKGETEQDRSNPVTEAGKDIRGAAVARQQEIAPLMIDRPESLLSVQGAKYIAQSALQSAPTTGTGLAAAVINPAAGLSLMGAGAGSAKFADARAEDKGYWLSAEAGAAAAAAEVVPEMLPLGFLSGRLLKHLPGTAMKRMASSPAGRGALLSLSEGASEGVTELSNIAYEIAREGKTYTDEQIANRLIDATAVGTVMGGGMAAVAEATGQNARAYDQSKIADLELENSLRAAIKPRATTARILGPTATPDAAAGAQIADDAFRAAGVGTVAAADMAEQDALARDLDAAQRDQLGSEAEIDRLFTGNTPRERTDLYRASIPGAIPQGMQVTSNQDAFAAPGTIGGRDAPAPIQVTTLADRSVFVPGDPVAIRRKLADAGSQWQGMAQERDGIVGVRFSPTSWTDVQGLIGGSIAPTANVAPEVAEAPAAAPPLDLTARRTNSDTKFDERVHDLTDFIALNGGLDRSALESEGIDPANWNSRKAKGQNDKFFGKPLFRKTGGMTLETLREKARDAGFRTDKDVLDLISESLGGRKTFTPAGSEYQMALADVARQEADAQARQQRVNALPLSVPETDADAYIASRETEFDAPADRDGADLADIESTLASVADTSPQQRASVVSLGHDYTAKLIELKRARAAGALNPDQQEAYIDLLEQDRETGKVAGRPMAGIGNKTAYVDALMQGKLMPVQAFLDADNFKALNDKFGHDVGDDVIRLIADVVRAEFGEGNVFHRGGDEFLTQGMTQEEVDAKMARVQDYLARVKMELPLSDGRTATLTGVGVSYGTGANEKAADDSLKQDKQRRKDAGLRFDRREGDDAGRVGSQSSGAGTEASGANSRDSSRAAAEGVGDERQNRTNLPDAGSSREVAGRRGDAERAPDDLGGSGPRTEAVRGGQAGSREVSGGIATVRSAISQALGAKFLRRLESQPWFHLVGTLADLPANIRKSITDGGNVAGFVLGNDVYIIADQASDPVGVTLHEVGVHFGMSGILGADFPAVLRNFKRQRAKDAAVGRAYERATEAAERGEDGELTADALATLDEEALAYYVEANWNAKDSRGIIAKVIDAIKSMLNRLGIPLSTLNASPEMLRKVAIGAARKAADGRVSVGEDGALRYHKAWHGSPHDFDKFRYDDTTSHTGEGAQAYGAGLYFAGNQEVAEHYRKPGPWSHRSDIMIDGVSVKRKAADSEAEKVALNALARTVTKADAIDYLQQDSGTEDAVDWIVANSARITDTAGRLYEVELAPDESDYLDWDAPLSEQSSKVQQSVYNLLTDLGVSSTVANYYASSKSGADVYREISRLAGGDKAASTKLRSEQVPGIRYLDGSSRGGKTGWRVKFKNGQYSGKVFDTKAEADAAVERGEYNMVDRVEKIDDLSHNFVIFDDSQVEVKAKYSRRADGGPVTESDKLVALHNVSPEGLLFADKIGGLAVPSIGITKAATPFTGFGSVTLIGSRDLATPSGDNPVFSADAFTQRFPDVEWPAVPYKKANDFLASIDPDVRRRDTDELHDHMVNHPDRDKAIDDGRKSATFMKAWLAEVGDAPAQDVTEKRVPPHRAQWAVRPAWTDAVDRLAARGVDVRNLREGSPEWAELDKAARQAIEQEADSYADLSKTLADEMREGMLAFFGDSLSLGDGDRAIRFAMAKDEAPRIDRYATKKTLQDQIGDRMPQFSAWVTSKIAPLFGEPSIRIGRKKVPMTLDNIVEAMTSKAVAGKESTMTFSTGKAKAMNAKRYRTLEEVQADRAKIVSTEAEKGAIDASDKLIEQYRDAVLPYTSEIYNDRIDTWAALDASMKALADAGKKAATVANMRSALARNGFRGVDDDTVQLGVDALIALRETVTDYFEAKPQRAVKLSEFAGAVVKSSEADQVRPVLEKHGVEVREYSGEGAERRVAIDEFTKELEAKRGKIRFSRRASPGSLRVVTAGDVVDGRTVREGVPNQSSISSSLDDYTILKGIREVPMDAFDKEYVDGIAEGRIDKRTQDLADAISTSKEITPLIVAYDADGAYIIEGGHRLDALIKIGAKSLPAMVVIDEANPPKPASEGLGASGPRYSRRTITIDGTERPTTDSTGKAIHPTEEGVRKFWEWFGDSKIVDAEGRPRVMYHGTHNAFGDRPISDSIEEFSAGKGERGISATNSAKQIGVAGNAHTHGLWFASQTEAMAYTMMDEFDGMDTVVPGGAVYPVYLKIESPQRSGWKDARWESVDDLKAAGKDGLNIIENENWVAFDPSQVKSALGNDGTFSPTDPRIAYSRKTPAEARAESAQKQADLGAQLVVSPGQSFVYTDKFTDDWRGQTLKMRERIQDKLLSVRNVQQDIEKIRGAIQDAMNVYRRENLMHGRVGDQRDKLQDTHVKPLIEAMAEAKVSPALLEDYLEARHAKERNEKIAAIKGGMPDGASGMTTQQAEDFLQGRAAGHRSGVTLDPAMTRQVSRLGRKVYAITAETRRRLLDSGQITQEAFDALENAYAAYVPLRGKDGTESGKGRGTGKGIDVRGKPIQRAAGRGEGNRAQNILAEVIADAERSIINAEKLRVGRTLARLVLENPNPDVWAIEPVKTELKVSDGTPEEIYEAVKNLDQEEGTIIVKVKGKPYRIVIEDQRMADALKNMAVETVPEVIQYVAGLNRYFSAVLTRYNPSFVGVNMTRDLLFGMTGIWAEHGTAAAAKAAASYFPAMRAAWRDIQGKPPVNAMGRYAREFAEAGGKTYFGKLENVSDMSQRIGEEFKTFRQMAMPKFLGGEMSPVRALAKVARDSKMVQAIEAVNDTVENTLRLSVYAARREAGASIEQAAEYAKNISVNFNRRGSATSWLNALYLFFNAATQGAHRTLTLLKNPKVQGVLGGLAALQATSAMFLMGLDDEDGEPLWDSISSWDKQRNLILAIPIKRENGWGATVIKIPMPYGFNLFPYMGGRSVELARDLQEKPAGRAIADYTTDAVVGVAQAMSPIPFDDGWKAALPHWVRIFTVLSENKDDLGIPIRAGDQYDSFDKPRSASGRDDTPLPFKVAATALNRLGGGDDYTPPYAKFALDWAPEDLAYLFKTFAGGLGSNVVKSGTLTEKLIAGVPVNFKDVPVLSSFVSNVDQRQATSTRYYDHKDDIEREVARQRDLAKETGEVGDNQMGIKIARNKSGVKVKRGEGYELEGKPGSLFDTYKQAEKDISRIRDEMRAAFNDQSISYTERIRKIDELKAEREEVQRELNAAWREQRKKRTQ